MNSLNNDLREFVRHEKETKRILKSARVIEGVEFPVIHLRAYAFHGLIFSDVIAILLLDIRLQEAFKRLERFVTHA